MDSTSNSGGESRIPGKLLRIYESVFMQKILKWLRGVWQVLSSTIQFFITRDVMNATAALTYSTLFATVPILAVVFAIARGFGLSKYIEEAFMNAMSSQPRVAEVLTGFVNSYLVHAQSSVIIGVGVVVMLVTVINLARKIEDTFNMIWQVKKQRDIVRSVINYIALFFLIPVILILSSGISIFMANFFKPLTETYIIGDAVKMGLNFVPYVFMMCVFTALYVLMPNTRVQLRYAIERKVTAVMKLDTAPIAAIATASGRGGVGIVRVSGKNLDLFIADFFQQSNLSFADETAVCLFCAFQGYQWR